MGKTSKTSPIVWVAVVALVALGAVAAWVMSAPKPEKKLEPWTFTSIRSGETELDAKNDAVVYSGDRLLARGPIVESRHDYVLLQDESKLEGTAAKARDAEMDGKPVRFSGVQLTRGTGRVRMVVIDSPTDLDGIPGMLKAANKVPGNSDKKLAALLANLKAQPENESTRVFTSPWYRLIAVPGYEPPPQVSQPDPANVPAPDGAASTGAAPAGTAPTAAVPAASSTSPAAPAK